MSREPKGEKPDEERDGARYEGLPVVGIGASAGGIAALEALLPHLRKDAGVAFVVIQHLHPTQPSILSTLLGRMAPIPVVQAADGMLVEADRVYVIPPNTTLTL